MFQYRWPRSQNIYKQDIKYPAVSFLVLFVLCLTGITAFEVIVKYQGINFGLEMELVFIGKIVKTISYLFIFFSILDWVMSVDNISKKIAARESAFRHATLAKFSLFTTLAVVGMLLVQIIGSVVNGEKRFSLGNFPDVIISMLPIIVLLYCNYKIMHEDSKPAIRKGAKVFYMYLYVPVVTATIAILILWGIAALTHEFLKIDDKILYVMVSGSMAFLVFVAHAADKMIHENTTSHTSMNRRQIALKVISIFCPNFCKPYVCGAYNGVIWCLNFCYCKHPWPSLIIGLTISIICVFLFAW